MRRLVVLATVLLFALPLMVAAQVFKLGVHPGLAWPLVAIDGDTVTSGIFI
jgi:hypothetical protein